MIVHLHYKLTLKQLLVFVRILRQAQDERGVRIDKLDKIFQGEAFVG